MIPSNECDVLIVGGGASGLAASMLLSSYGIKTHLVSKYDKTSNLPKAHVIAIKTMEIFRELGIEDAVRRNSTPQENMRYAGFYAGFGGTGPDHGRPIVRVGAWGRGGQDVDWVAASSVLGTNLMQSQLEPLMKAKADELAPEDIHFYRNFLRFEEVEDGIVATIEDRASGDTYEVRARYLLACDGGRVVGPQVGVEMEGELGVATSVSIHFSADLSPWFRDTEALTCSILNPDAALPCVLVPMGPEKWGAETTEWLVHLGSLKGDHKLFDDATAIQTMKDCLGLPDLDCTVHVINRWPLDAVVATRYRVGRAFMLGDAAHRNPPTGGHGLNAAIQDAYNISWKLAAVIKGTAGDSLLDSYEAERRPLAQHIVATSFGGWEKQRGMMMAIGFSPKNTPEQNWSNVRRVWQEDAEGDATRKELANAVVGILPNYSSLNVGFGYSYETGALMPDGTPSRWSHDPLEPFHPSTRPGCSIPDIWVDTLVGRIALGDIVARGKLVLIAGEQGQGWRDAAERIAQERGIALDAIVIGGTAGDWLDLRGAWGRAREHGPEGAILVRPDRFIAWRATEMAENPYAALNDVFDTILAPERIRVPAEA
ncbi:FAD-dependent monooxygenase [Sphingomonas sp. UYEF23]|uniref:FAD-dependent monooxygenase n=1 Tax=Sphingomonas sp. UYEF23 TaxID=1756408 RepID=UPI00339598F9